MNKTLFGILATVLLAPLPSLADDLIIRHSNDELPDVLVASESTLIKVSVDADNNISGRVWSESANDWSAAEDIFTDNDTKFDLTEISTIKELNNGTIVMADGDDVISYSTADGFTHYTLPFTWFNAMVVSGNEASFVDNCSDEAGAPDVVRWSETDGFDMNTSLTSSVCTTGDVNYFTSNKNTFIDYYSGVAYDRSNNHAVLDTIDLTGLNYVDASDDWDSQGNNPNYALKNSGDVAFAFETSLYGYAYNDDVWRSLVTLPDGFSIVGGGSGDYDYSPLQTENGQHIFSFTANEDQTEYEIYRWTSADGWQLEKTYTLSSTAELVTTNIDKTQNTLDWAFYLTDADELRVYQWSEADGYVKRTEREITCSDNCNITLDISKKNKAFIVANSTSSADTNVMAWKPGPDTWEDSTLGGNNYTTTHVTNTGRWVVVYQKNNTAYSAKRWTPDSGWGGTVELNAEGTYYNGDRLVYVDLSIDDTLTVNLYKWNTGTSVTMLTEIGVTNFYDDDESTFVYDGHMFVFYDDVIKAIELG